MRIASRRAGALLACGTATMWMLAGCGGPEPPAGMRATNVPAAARAAPPPQPQAEPLAEAEATPIDLTDPSKYAPTWVTRVKECSLSHPDDGTLVCTVLGSDSTAGGQYGGVQIKTGPAKAIRVDVTFDRPENITGAFMDLAAGDSKTDRIRWQMVPNGADDIPSGEQSLTFRVDKAAGGFEYVGGPASMEAAETAQFFIRVKPNTETGFRIHRVLTQK